MMSENCVGTLCVELSAWCHAVRRAKELGVALPKLDAAGILRAHGKKCCGAHAVLTSIAQSALPKEIAGLGQHVAGIEARLRKKGIGAGEGMIPLPKHFQAVLNQLKEAGVTAKGEKAKDAQPAPAQATGAAKV